ncbi:6184_t:CDS:2, partial [Dentiscutata heterogama]
DYDLRDDTSVGRLQMSASIEEGEIQDGEQTAQSLQCNDCQKLLRDASAAQNHATKTGHVNFSESTTAIKPLTEEEKKAKLLELKQRLAEKRELRVMQEKEEEKSRERMRRQSGRELSEAKSKLEEKEMQKLLIAKKKEKEDEKIAKAKIKAQIEADKKERAAKREAAKQATQAQKQEEAAAEAAVAAVKKEYTETRLQIRQQTGAPITQTFQSTDTLQIVYDLVSQHVHGPFTLMTTFPRKVLGDSEMQKTLKDLNLVPSAVLVVNTS